MQSFDHRKVREVKRWFNAGLFLFVAHLAEIYRGLAWHGKLQSFEGMIQTLRLRLDQNQAVRREAGCDGCDWMCFRNRANDALDASVLSYAIGSFTRRTSEISGDAPQIFGRRLCDAKGIVCSRGTGCGH